MGRITESGNLGLDLDSQRSDIQYNLVGHAEEPGGGGARFVFWLQSIGIIQPFCSPLTNPRPAPENVGTETRFLGQKGAHSIIA